MIIDLDLTLDYYLMYENIASMTSVFVAFG